MRTSIYADVDDHDELTDHIRVDFARKLIAGQGGESSYVFAVIRVPIRDTRDRDAVLGYLVNTDSPEWHWRLHGVFTTEQAFMDSLRHAGFVDESLPGVSDADLLKLWGYQRHRRSSR